MAQRRTAHETDADGAIPGSNSPGAREPTLIDDGQIHSACPPRPHCALTIQNPGSQLNDNPDPWGQATEPSETFGVRSDFPQKGNLLGAPVQKMQSDCATG